jgi:hypothetical protein
MTPMVLQVSTNGGTNFKATTQTAYRVGARAAALHRLSLASVHVVELLVQTRPCGAGGHGREQRPHLLQPWRHRLGQELRRQDLEDRA